MNPDYKKRKDALFLYMHIFTYMNAYFGGVEEFAFVTNGKMQKYINKMMEVTVLAECNPNSTSYMGKNPYEGITDGNFSITKLAFMREKCMAKELEYLIP